MRKLVEIKGVGKVMEVACAEKGYRSVQDIAEASVTGLSSVSGIGRIRARELINSAQILLNDAPPLQNGPLTNGAEIKEIPAEAATLEGATGQSEQKEIKTKKDKTKDKKKSKKSKKDKKKQKDKKKKKSVIKKSERKKDKKKSAKKQKKKTDKKKNKKSKKDKKGKKGKKKNKK